MTTSRLDTDKADYKPGETATITASGFVPGSDVTFEVDHVSGPGADGIYGTLDDQIVELGGKGHDAWTVKDGGKKDLDGKVNGQVVTTWFVHPDDSLGARFLLTASADGWVASTTFTDANPNTGGSPVNPVVSGSTPLLFDAYTTAGSTGTGIISSFVRMQAPKDEGFESGYNTSGRPLQFDENTSAQFTYAITLAMVPRVTVAGQDYFQFNIDLNESDKGTGPLITLHNIKLFASASPTLNNMNTSTLIFPTSDARLLYDMDGAGDVSVELTDWNSGSGTGDYRVSVPVSFFNGVSFSEYVYLYSEFGTKGGSGSPAEGGFEEWFVVKQSTASMTIDKVAAPDQVANVAGELLNYTITVTNTGNVILTGVTLSDPGATVLRLTDLSGDNDALLEVGEIWQYSATRAVSQADLDTDGGGDGDIDNTATADSNETAAVSDSAVIPVSQNKSLQVVKTADVESVTAPGTLTYSYTVTNTGNAAIANVVVVDDNGTPGNAADDVTLEVDAAGDIDGDGKLDVGEVWEYEYEFAVTQDMMDDGADIVNIVTASGTGTTGDTDTESVAIDQNPVITVVKDNGGVVDGDGNGDDAGDTIVYSYMVSNTGNVTLYDVTADDDLLGLVSLVGLTDEDDDGDADDLAVGASASGTKTATLTQDDIDAGSVVNVVTASGTAPDEEPVTDDDTNTVAIDQNPVITIDKVTVSGSSSGDNLTGLIAGDAIAWRYTVTNAGNTTLANVYVTDDNGSPGNTADDFTLTRASGYVSGDTDGDSLLDVGESWIFEKAGTAVAGTYMNLGTAHGSSGPTTVHASDDSSYTASAPSALIAPTNTTPYQYISGTYQTFQEYYASQGGDIQYGVRGGKIGQTNPGVFFYFTGASGDIVGADGIDNDTLADQMTITIDQQTSVLNPSGGTATPFFNPLNFTKNNYSSIQVYKVIDDGDGVVDGGDSLQAIKLRPNSVTMDNDGDLSITFTPDAVGSMYIVSVKYATGGVTGYALPSGETVWPTVNYTFSTMIGDTLIETYEGGVDLAPKSSSTMNLAGEGGDGAPTLREGQLKAVMKAAVAYWEAQGEDVSAFDDVSVGIADLGMEDDTWVLGEQMGNTLWIDDDAAGHGWSLSLGPVAPHRVDLFSVLVHELGHVLGMDDEEMGDGLEVGQRLLPAPTDTDSHLPLPAQLLGMVGTQPHAPDMPFA